MRKILLFISLLSINVYADLDKAPKNFNVDNKRAVFIDIISLKSEILFDVSQKKTYAKSIIVFNQNEKGHPLFDLVPSADKVLINGQKTKALEVNSPDKVTEFKLVNTLLEPGTHTLIIENQIRTNTLYSRKDVASGFWMSDLKDRQYLEQYLPSNLEYDQYKIDFKVEVIGSTQNHILYANGEVKELSQNKFEVSFPSYFQASSVYFHLTPEGKIPEMKYNYTSIDGRVIPITLYSKLRLSINSYKTTSLQVLAELEKTYGPWPHPSLIIYGAGMGGMEHSGATITSLQALGHELMHSYYARGVMPQNGNSGWLDEAIASWRDKGYPTVTQPNFRSTSMAAHSSYLRSTDRKAYTEGANFMAYLDSQLEDQGGLRIFLKELFTEKVYQNMTTEEFIKKLNLFSGKNFNEDFRQYIYGGKGNKKAVIEEERENPMHPKLTKEQLLDLL